MNCKPMPAGILGLVLLASAGAQTDEQIRFFEKNVRPVLSANCQACHGEQLKTAGLDLSSREGIQKGAGSGPVILPDAPDNSKLLEVIRYTGRVKMPPRGVHRLIR